MPFVGKRSDFAYSPADSGNGIVTRTPIVFLDSKGRWWIAPKGFPCDGGSVPRPFWPVAGHPLQNDAIRAFVLHDRYYTRPDGRLKSQIDRMFFEALRAEGDGYMSAQAKWTAVRWFGRFAWNAHRRREGVNGRSQ